MTDIDAGALLGIAVIAVDTVDGTWFYTTDGGTNWNPMGAVVNSNARLLSLDANSRMYFRPNADLEGPIASALTFRAWDRTAGSNGGTFDSSFNGGATAFSTAFDTADITVTGVNDAPNTVAPTNASMQEDTTLAFTGGNQLSVFDPEDFTLSITLTVTDGTLTMTTLTGLSFSTGDGSADVTMTFSGTLPNLNNALSSLTFTPTGDYYGSASLTFSATEISPRPRSRSWR